jgi:hypothetical protein
LGHWPVQGNETITYLDIIQDEYAMYVYMYMFWWSKLANRSSDNMLMQCAIDVPVQSARRQPGSPVDPPCFDALTKKAFHHLFASLVNNFSFVFAHLCVFEPACIQLQNSPDFTTSRFTCRYATPAHGHGGSKVPT